MCNRLTKLSVTMWYTFFGIFDDTSLWILSKTHDPSLCDTPDDYNNKFRGEKTPKNQKHKTKPKTKPNQNKTKQNKTKQNKTKQNKTKQNKNNNNLWYAFVI